MRNSFSRVDAARPVAGDGAGGKTPMSWASDRTISSRPVLPHAGHSASESEQAIPGDIVECANRFPEPAISLQDTGKLKIDILAEKAGAAFDVLQGRFANRISDVEVDHLFACFVFGLTAPVCARAEPSDHLDICRTLTALRLPPERVHAALHEVPQPTEPWVEDACETLERQGAKIGLTLAARMPVGENPSDAYGNAAASTDRKVEERQP